MRGDSGADVAISPSPRARPRQRGYHAFTPHPAWRMLVLDAYDSNCIDHLEGSFASSALSLIQLCLEDNHIWIMQYEEALNMQAYVEEMEREWPGGRPDQDWEYQ